MDSLQKMLSDACEDMGGECQFRNDYSGRGMYGARCVGITGSYRDCQRVIASVLGTMTQDLFDTAIDSNGNDDAAYALNDTVQGNIDKLMDMRSDSMGLDVICYWERLEPLTDEEIGNDLPTDAQFDEMSEGELLRWVADNREYHTDEDNVENHGAVLATAKLMRDRISEDVPS
jgi:hypothetical protein